MSYHSKKEYTKMNDVEKRVPAEWRDREKLKDKENDSFWEPKNRAFEGAIIILEEKVVVSSSIPALNILPVPPVP